MLLGYQTGGKAKDLVRRLEGNDEQPIDRKDEDDDQQARHKIAQGEADIFAAVKWQRLHFASPIRLMAQVTTTVRMTMTRNAMAAV